MTCVVEDRVIMMWADVCLATPVPAPMRPAMALKLLQGPEHADAALRANVTTFLFQQLVLLQDVDDLLVTSEQEVL